MDFNIIKVQPGFYTTEFHKHCYRDECVYIFEGKGEDIFAIKTGDFLGFRAGCRKKNIKNQ